MSTRILRLVIAFLGGFVLLSMVPALPDAMQVLQRLPRIDQLGIDQLGIDRVGDILLGITAGLCTVLLLVTVRQRRRATPHAFQQALARQATSHAMVQPAARVSYAGSRAKPEPAIAASRPDSELQARIRQCAKKGERAPALARRHSLSVDAIRLALGEPVPAPAARRGRSFRTRQPSLPAKPAAKAVANHRNSYGALA